MEGMDLNEHYERIWHDSLTNFNLGKFEIDPMIDLASDTRRGITLLARPCKMVRDRIAEFTSELKEIEPNQYYYPSTDIHVTVMSIISCYPDFRIESIDRSAFIKRVRQSLHNIKTESIQFKGVTASTSCVMLKGFPIGGMLNLARKNLRAAFNQSDLEHSIDKRYAIKTAHSTVVRFKSKVSNSIRFLKVLDKYRDFDFGTSIIDNYELVFNDWYHRKDRTEVLHLFEMKRD